MCGWKTEKKILVVSSYKKNENQMVFQNYSDTDLFCILITAHFSASHYLSRLVSQKAANTDIHQAFTTMTLKVEAATTHLRIQGGLLLYLFTFFSYGAK